MAVTFDDAFEAGTGAQASPFSFTSGSGTVPGTVGANNNRVLIGFLGARATSVQLGTPSMTWAGAGMTLIGQLNESVFTLALFGLIAPTTGSQTLSASWTGAHATVTVIGGISVYEANQSTGWQNFTSTSATGTAASLTVTSANGNMVVGGRSDDNSSGETIADGTEDWNDRNFNGNYGGVHRASVSSSTVIGWTISSVLWGMVGVDVIAASGGGLGPVNPHLQPSFRPFQYSGKR